MERHQRPSVMGHKNYLLSKDDRGAEDKAVFYSLLQSCEVAGVNPLQWLTHVIERIGDDTCDEELRQMLAYNYKKSHN